MRYVWILAVSATLLAVGSRRTLAQDCAVCVTGCSPGAHIARSPYGIWASPHTSCNVCPGGECDLCHEYCVGTFDALASAAYRSVLDASQRGDVSTILSLTPLIRHLVQYNVQRQSIQVLSCNGDLIIASFRLKTSAMVTSALHVAKPTEAAHVSGAPPSK